MMIDSRLDRPYLLYIYISMDVLISFLCLYIMKRTCLFEIVSNIKGSFALGESL